MQNSFFSLSPDHVLKCVEDCGYITTGEFYQLNSYENRVFDIRLENPQDPTRKQSIVAKFYRPQRWSQEALLEEHNFLYELKAEGVSVVAPLILNNKKTLKLFNNEIFYTLFPKTLGRMPQEFVNRDLVTVGRLIARLHNCGAQKAFRHRPTLQDGSHLGWNSLPALQKWVAPDLWPRYSSACENILDYLDDRLPVDEYVRLHGDCHRGNLLSDGTDFFFVDFDDSINGPPVQDFWMLLSGDMESSKDELDQLLSGYTELRDFDEDDLELIPALRGLRIFSYAAWIANRWHDPSFPKLFPDFNSYVYWAEEVEALEKVSWSL